jgi:REP element-mobilizing transposase RayT
LLAWYCTRVDQLLDAGAGACWLSRPDIARCVAEALTHFTGRRYELPAWVVMPNHVHALVWPFPGQTLSGILHSWKSFTSKRANALLRRRGTFWQRESFDHWIRDREEHAHLVRYIEANPVKARLVTRPEDWPWSSARSRG